MNRYETKLRGPSPRLAAWLAVLAMSMALVGQPVRAAAPTEAEEAVYQNEIRPLLSDYCRLCHGNPRRAKAGLSFREFDTLASVRKALPTWKVIYDQIDTHAMPPRDELQPTEAERAKLLHWLENQFNTPTLDGRMDPGKPVLRRLTRLEYNNTVRDLFALDEDVFMFPERLPIDARHFDPSGDAMPERIKVRVREYGARYPVLLPQAGLPSDGRAAHGFSNRGDIMTLTPLMLERYVELAGQIVNSPKLMRNTAFRDLVLPPGAVLSQARSDQPITAAMTIDAAAEVAPNDNVKVEVDGAANKLWLLRDAVRQSFDVDHAGVFDAEGDGHAIRGGDGIHVKFGASRKKTLVMLAHTDTWIAGFGTAEEASGGVLVTNRNKGRNRLAFDLRVAGGEPGEAVTEVGLIVLSRKGQSGPVAVTAQFSDGKKQTLTHEMAEGFGAGNAFVGFQAPPGLSISRVEIDGSMFSGDYVLIDDVAFITATRGEPAANADGDAKVADVPSPSQKDKHKQLARQRLKNFLPRALRRPITDEELARYGGTFDAGLEAGASFEQAMKWTVQSVLASPNFLYRLEPAKPGAGAVRSLGDHELANRLAYFLWSSMPDAALMQLADAGRLSDPAVLEAQARRMLKDARVRELVESFAVQWLRLDQLYASKPDRRMFGEFYEGPQDKSTAHASMLVEPLLLFETVLVEDRSILEFVDADYGWMNHEMMTLYGYDDHYEPVWSALLEAPADPPSDPKEARRQQREQLRKISDVWFRCKLPDRSRGGVMTTGATLTLTSLPTRTSPVKRGAWLLETMFNRPPKEPKVAVAPLEEVESEDKPLTVRQKLEMHRDHAACAVCHDLIDPPGFALENFNAIGTWREKEGEAPVDASGELSEGRAFDGPGAFKQAVLQRDGDFTRAFVEHMLAYALGRKLHWYDVPTVRAIQQKVEADGHRFSRVIIEIARSYPFRHVRNEADSDPSHDTQEIRDNAADSNG